MLLIFILSRSDFLVVCWIYIFRSHVSKICSVESGEYNVKAWLKNLRPPRSHVGSLECRMSRFWPLENVRSSHKKYK
jgi:hypothetical protein